MLSFAMRHWLTLAATVALILTFALPIATQAQSSLPVKLSPSNGSPIPSVTATSHPSVKPTPGSHHPLTSASVTVVGTQAWTDTGIDLSSGNSVTITASGTIYFASGPAVPYGPDGNTGCIAASDYPAPGLHCWSLVGNIANGTPFQVGSSTSFPAGASGRLYLGVNDNVLTDNSGSWSATVTVTASGSGTTITSTSGWQQTALNVQQGTQFAISYTSPSASGTWTVDVNNFSNVGADGYTPNIDQQIFQGCKYDSSLPYATLLGQIGSGSSFAVSVGSVFTASQSGILSLRINDQDGCLGDNAGSVTVGVASVPSLAFPFSTTSTDGAAVWYLSAGPHCDNAGNTCNITGYEKRYALDFMPPGPAGCSSIDRINSGWVTAAASGTVVYAANNLVEIDHNGFRTGYYHLYTGTIAVVPGNFVTSGQHLGRPSCDTGLGGTSSGIHVHFYICIQPNPQQICYPNAQNGTNIGGINIIGGTDIVSSSDGLMLSGWTTQLTSGNHNGTMTKPNQQNRTANTSQCGIDDIGCGSRNDLPPNLLKNANFELDTNADGKPDSWSLNSHFTRSSATTPQHCSVCGQNPQYVGMHHATDNSGYKISSNAVPNLTAGTTYTFIGWVNIPSTSDSFTFKIQIRWRNASNATISTITIGTFTRSTGNVWSAAANYNLLAPTGTTNAQILMVVSSLNATIYVDDFLFQPK